LPDYEVVMKNNLNSEITSLHIPSNKFKLHQEYAWEIVQDILEGKGLPRRGSFVVVNDKLAYLLDSIISHGPDKGMPGPAIRDGDVFLYLAAIVKLFDEHAKKIGGTGFFYGAKSKLKSLFTDSHRFRLKDFILQTPEFMLHQSRISEDDPNLTKTFVKFYKLMPTTYDTRETCRRKILQCMRIIFSGRSDKFYQDKMGIMKRITKASWI